MKTIKTALRPEKCDDSSGHVVNFKTNMQFSSSFYFRTSWLRLTSSHLCSYHALDNARTWSFIFLIRSFISHHALIPLLPHFRCEVTIQWRIKTSVSTKCNRSRSHHSCTTTMKFIQGLCNVVTTSIVSSLRLYEVLMRVLVRLRSHFLIIFVFKFQPFPPGI